jgi:hypothetical protein
MKRINSFTGKQHPTLEVETENPACKWAPGAAGISGATGYRQK